MRRIDRTIIRTGVIGALLVLSAGSCTVKEDRMPCPCYLNVSFSERESIPEKAEVGLLGWNAAELFRAGIDVADYDPYWVKAVRKGVFYLSAYRGVSDTTPGGRYITISPGFQSDSLYAYHTEVDARGELAYADVTFRKQFCTVHLDIMRRPSELRQFRFLVEGNTCGFDLLTFDAVPGTFRFEPVPEDGTRVVDFRIPRQVDDSMSLTLWYRNEDGTFDNIGTFPLGRYIVRTGYNWKAEELQDVYILIDLVLGHITIGVDGWEDGAVFTFIEQ